MGRSTMPSDGEQSTQEQPTRLRSAWLLVRDISVWVVAGGVAVVAAWLYTE